MFLDFAFNSKEQGDLDVTSCVVTHIDVSSCYFSFKESLNFGLEVK